MKAIPAVLNNTWLKIIALLSMITDHTCMVLFPHSAAALTVRLTAGRIAMPLYVFLICEGFYHTHSRAAYGRNLLLFAILSEPVYDLARYGTFFDFENQNVFFSLFMGLLLLCTLDFLERRNHLPLALPVIAGFMGLTWLLHFDYEYSAVLMFAVLYFLRRSSYLIQGAASCTVLAAVYSIPAVYLAVIPLSLYNGKRGRIRGSLKYLFYILYPAHLLILYLLKAA